MIGVHISKVRSLYLDDLDDETISLLLEMGNEVVNEIYEKQIGLETNRKGTADSTKLASEIPLRATPNCD